MCDSGSHARQLASSVTRNTSMQARTLEQMLPWVSMTPFGGPAVPDVWIRAARPGGGAPSRVSRMHGGRAAAARPHVGADVAVGEHDGLRRARRARRVDQGRQVRGRDRERVLPEAGVPGRGCAPARFDLGERHHTFGGGGGLERDHVPQGGQRAAHRAHLGHLRGRRAHHGHRAGVAQNVLRLVGGERGINGHVGGAHAQAGVVGQRPFQARLREDGHAVARADAELEQAGAQRLHALRDLPVRDRAPRPVGLVPERGGMTGVPLHTAEEQLGQGAGAHGSNCTVNRIGEPGSRALTPRLALAVTTTLARAGPAMRRSRTAATPRASVVTVSAVTQGRAVSLVTNVTGPGVPGDVMVNTTARPGSGVMAPVAAAVSSTSTLKESESESGVTAETCTVSTIGPAARSGSATPTPRNRTTNGSGEPGTTVWFARCALATTTTLSGMVSGASSRSFTNAMPALFDAAVSVVAARAVSLSLRTSVTGPATVGWTIA